MSVEEAIEILKEIIELHEDNCYLSTEDDFKAIKTLIVAYKKQSKEIEELKEIIKRDYISKKKLYKHIEMLEKENCHETCTVKKLINCESQCSIGCTIKNIKKILEE